MLIINNSLLGFWRKSDWINYKFLQKMNSAIGYSEGAEVPEDKTEVRFKNFNKHHEDVAEILIKCLGVNSRQVHWREAAPIIASYVSKETASERNKAIDECMNIVEMYVDKQTWDKLESLKNKPI